MSDDIIKDNSYWKEKLSPETYYVMREEGTERAFSGKYHDNKEKGMYHCASCGAELFSSDTKFDSGTGWPSFTEVVNSENIETREDSKLFMKRVEVHCRRCGGHLGHVFPDGPKTLKDGEEVNGDRYCINSASLDFKNSK